MIIFLVLLKIRADHVFLTLCKRHLYIRPMDAEELSQEHKSVKTLIY